MAKKWREVIQNPEYQKLPDAEKDEARSQYFEEVVAPQIPANERADAFKEFIVDTHNMELDYEIKRLESKVKPEPSMLDNIKNKFTDSPDESAQKVFEHYDRENLEALKERRRLNTPETILDKYKASIIKGAENSTMGKLINTYLEDGANDLTKVQYEPQGTGENIASGLAGMAVDVPLYALGSGVTTGGVIAKSAGAFALPKAIDKTLDIRREKGSVGLEDYGDILQSTGEGAVEGALFGVAGAPGRALRRAIKSPGWGKAAGLTSDVALESAVMLGSAGYHGQDITGQTLGEIGGTVLAMKLLHRNPYTLQELKSRSEKTGIPIEKLAENLNAEQAKMIRSAEEAKAAADYAQLKTEAQIKREFETRAQEQIIDKQIRANYKDGKTAADIVKLEQIPKEHLAAVADIVEGRLQVKPEVLQRVDDIINGRDPVISQKYEDILPGPMREMALAERNKVVNDYASTKKELEVKKDVRDWYEEQRPAIHEQFIAEELNKLTGNYSRYAHQPKIREKMDAVIDHTLSIMTPEERFMVAQDPSIMRQFIDSVESGYNDLKKPYQEAIQKEIIAKIIQETGYTPGHVISDANRKADYKIKIEDKRYHEPVKNLESNLKSLESNPEYKAYLESQKPVSDFQMMDALERKLEPLQAERDKALSENLVKFQKVMGVSSEYGDRALNAKEVYGNHYNSLVEFQKKSVEDLQKTFEQADYLDMHVNAKSGLDNKSRVIQQKLGEKVYRAFADPLREAGWTFTKELSIAKDAKKELLKGMSKEAKTEIVDYMYGRQQAARDSLTRMNIKPKAWEELTAQQQAAVNYLDTKFKDFFDRLNVSREMVGMEPLNKVDDYFTLISQVSLLERLGYNPHNVSRDVFDNIEISNAKTRALSFAFGKSRVKNDRELERDLDSALDRYYYSALRTIHMTPVIGKLRDAISSEKFMTTNPNAQKYLDMTLDFVSGKRISEAKEITNYWANVLHRNLSGAVLAGNLHTVIVQPSSALITAQEIGPLFLAKGVRDWGSDAMKKFAMDESKVLLGRVYDASIDEVKKGITGKLSQYQAKGIEWGMLPTKYTDKWAAQVTWLGGYRYASEALNLNHKGSVAYADDLVVRTQGSADRLDLAPIQHTPLGKLFTTFQTFGINQFNYLKDEVIGAGKINKLVAENVPGKQADAQFNSDKYIKKPLGKDKDGNQFYNIYEQRRMKEPLQQAKDIAKYAVILGAISTVYELLDGVTPDMISMGSPNPAPVSAFFEGATGQKWVDALYGQNPTKKEVSLTDGLVASMKEFANLIPIVGGSAKFGGSNMFGAMGALISDTGDLLAGKPGAKDWQVIISKWAGVPGATQIHRILKELQKERIAAHKKTDPMREVKRQMRESSPFRKESTRYKDPGIYQGAVEQLLD